MQAGSLREHQPAIDASSVQVLIGESPKQRHARTPRPETAAPMSNPGSPEQRHARIPRPDAAAPKSNPGSPYQRHEGIPRPDAAAPNPAAGGICFAARVGHGVGLLLFFNAVAVMLGSSWLVPVCVATLLQARRGGGGGGRVPSPSLTPPFPSPPRLSPPSLNPPI